MSSASDASLRLNSAVLSQLKPKLGTDIWMQVQLSAAAYCSYLIPDEDAGSSSPTSGGYGADVWLRMLRFPVRSGKWSRDRQPTKIKPPSCGNIISATVVEIRWLG